MPDTYLSSAETGFYYLNARYYDSEVGRFISADEYVSTGQGVLGNNMFLYCGNNPIVRRDATGNAWETVFDGVSLATSGAEVVADPRNAWNWAGLVGDALDLIPVLTGVGETVRGIKTAKKVDNIVDISNNLKKGWKVGDDINNLTKAGNVPSWSTVRSRYWKNEAYFNSKDYLYENVLRMQKGKAPLVQYINGKSYSMELYHITPRYMGGSNDYNNLLKVSPWDHAKLDLYRIFKP